MRKLISIISITILGAGVAAYAASSPVSNGSSGTGTAMVQQDATWILHGTVVDSENVPVIGAGVINLNTKTGDITNNDGKFGVSVKVGDRLEVSCIGYSTKEIVVTSQDNIVVILENDSELLEEVVVMGYGTQKKKLVTGSTVNVTSDKIAAVNAVDAFGALQSQAAGLSIVSNSGQPGESYKVIIRGISTTDNTDPLYVVDGVPDVPITDISPNDIESIDVLKDGASSAIYGSRAANGVIMITTKKGKSGKISVTYDGYYGIQNPNTNGVTPLDAAQYMEIINKAYDIQGTEGYDFAALIPKQYAQIKNGTWKGTNWFKESINKNAPITNHSVTISGGNEVSRFALGFTYFGQEGTIGYPAKPEYDRTTVRLNSDHVLLRKGNENLVRFGENIIVSLSDKSGVAIGNNYNNSIRDLLIATPLLPLYNEDGDYYVYKDMQADDWNFNQDFKNPLAALAYDHGNNQNRGLRINSNFFLEIKPIKYLTFKSSFGWKFYQTDYRRYIPAYELSANNSKPNDEVTQRQSNGRSITLENTLNYVRSFGNHNFDILVGQSLERDVYGSSLGVVNENSLFPNSFKHAYIDNANVVSAANTSISGAPMNQNRLLSFFGRINYNYNETYLLSLILRVDGSSNFARGHRQGIFPSVSAGWVVSNEEFMKSTSDWLSFLKIRGSFGRNGNCRIKPFQYLSIVELTNPYYFSDKNTPSKGSYPSIIPNSDISWETSQQLNFGLDARFFKSRLGLIFDWYRKETLDWLVDAPVKKYLGADPSAINGGDVRNSGIEFVLSWNDMASKDFSYGASLSFAYNKNEVTRIANSDGIIHGPLNVIAQNTDELFRVQVGYPIGYFWGYKTDGVIQNDADLQNYIKANCGGDPANSLQGNGLQAGDLKFVDNNHDGVVNIEDKTMIGDPHPDINIGLNLNMAYKGFDISISGYGAFGQQIAKSYRHFSNKPDENYTTDVFTKYWTGPGSTNRYPRFSDGKNTNMSEVSQLWLEDGDYFKFSTITLGYDLKRVAKFLPVSRCRVYVSAQNMVTITKYTGMDPEVGFGNGVSWASGIDVGNYPGANSWLFGLNITF